MAISKKWFSLLLTVILILGILPVQVYAAEENFNGISIQMSTDKAEYSPSDPISLQINAVNNGTATVQNVRLTTELPDGYSIDSEENLQKKVDELRPGKKLSLSVVFNPNKGDKPAKPAKPTLSVTPTPSGEPANKDIKPTVIPEPEKKDTILEVTQVPENKDGKPSYRVNGVFTGDTSTPLLWIGLFILAAIVLLIIVLIMKNNNHKDNKRFLSLFLILSLGFGLLHPNTKTVYAADTKKDTVRSEKTIQVSGGKIVLKASLSYETGTTQISDVDSDQDEIPDEIEEILGIDSSKEDTDGDGLSDFLEIYYLLYDPLQKDTDHNGIEDGKEDSDQDGLTNIEEAKFGTRPDLADTDSDTLSDSDEIKVYKTDPLSADTDGDDLDDNKEIELGTDPLTFDSDFRIVKEPDEYNPEVEVSVELDLAGEQVETLTVEKNGNPSLFPEDMPGYIGSAYDFSVEGDFSEATISFAFPEELLNNPEFDPVIYYFNEEEQELEELDTYLTGNIASADVEHFSTYILMDRAVFQKAFMWTDVWETSEYYGADIIFVIDDSGSMDNNDRYNERLAVAQDLIDHLPENARTGVIQFASGTTVLTEMLTTDRESVKSLLTTSYFRSSGATYMYNAINAGFDLFADSDPSAMKGMIVLTDGDTSDTGMHVSTISRAIAENVKIYTVGLGNATGYFSKYLEPLANDTTGAFYFAADANALSSIYEDIGKHIDIETDSDSDGIADYYEENMVLFNGCKIVLDKNNPDTDGDGLLDGDEIEMSYEYNEDGSQAIVTGKMHSNPTRIDSDDDGLYDNEPRIVDEKVVAPKDPEPLRYNGKRNMWKSYITSQETDIIPTEYCKDDPSFRIIEKLPDFAANIIVKFITTLDPMVVTFDEACRFVGSVVKGCYSIMNFGLDIADEAFDIGEIDEIVGAYILNFVHDDCYIAYHSQPDTWQAKFGYNVFYDHFFDVGTTMTTTGAINFDAEGTKYALWMWKGDYYNMHSGAEIGIYEDTGSTNIWGIKLYDASKQRFPMMLNLYYYISSDDIPHVFGWAPSEKQWWITGFNTDYDYEEPGYKAFLPVVVGMVDFKDHEAMYTSLQASVSNPEESQYYIFDEDGHTVWIMWDINR